MPDTQFKTHVSLTAVHTFPVPDTLLAIVKMAKEVVEAYNAIINNYKITNEKFVDKEFPANNSSIGNLPEIQGQLQWLRPPQIKARKRKEITRRNSITKG
ncbi:unnamed protein product, partial [Allacma fusca]